MDSKIQASQEILFIFKYGCCNTTGPVNMTNVMFFRMNCRKTLFFKTDAWSGGAHGELFDGAADHFRVQRLPHHLDYLIVSSRGKDVPISIGKHYGQRQKIKVFFNVFAVSLQ